MGSFYVAQFHRNGKKAGIGFTVSFDGLVANEFDSLLVEALTVNLRKPIKKDVPYWFTIAVDDEVISLLYLFTHESAAWLRIGVNDDPVPPLDVFMVSGSDAAVDAYLLQAAQRLVVGSLRGGFFEPAFDLQNEPRRPMAAVVGVRSRNYPQIRLASFLRLRVRGGFLSDERCSVEDKVDVSRNRARRRRLISLSPLQNEGGRGRCVGDRRLPRQFARAIQQKDKGYPFTIQSTAPTFLAFSSRRCPSSALYTTTVQLRKHVFADGAEKLRTGHFGHVVICNHAIVFDGFRCGHHLARIVRHCVSNQQA